MTSGARKISSDDNGRDHETRVQADDKLELRTWLRLLTCSNLVERQVRNGLRRQFDTTLPRFDVLAQLERLSPNDAEGNEAPNGAPGEAGLTMGELSERLMVSPGNLTGLVSRLVSEGLVARVAQPEDRRSFRVSLTAEGRRQFLGMTPVNEQWVDDLFGDLSHGELQQLYSLLGKMKRSVNNAGDVTGGGRKSPVDRRHKKPAKMKSS